MKWITLIIIHHAWLFFLNGSGFVSSVHNHFPTTTTCLCALSHVHKDLFREQWPPSCCLAVNKLLVHCFTGDSWTQTWAPSTDTLKALQHLRVLDLLTFLTSVPMGLHLWIVGLNADWGISLNHSVGFSSFMYTNISWSKTFWKLLFCESHVNVSF